MKASFLRRPALASLIGLAAVISSGCVVTGGGYGYGDGVGIGVDYYEPYGAVYGGWAPSYHVAPVRDDYHRPESGSGHPAPHAYRAAPPSRSMPSIPSRSGSGDSRSH